MQYLYGILNIKILYSYGEKKNMKYVLSVIVRNSHL